MTRILLVCSSVILIYNFTLLHRDSFGNVSNENIKTKIINADKPAGISRATMDASGNIQMNAQNKWELFAKKAFAETVEIHDTNEMPSKPPESRPSTKWGRVTDYFNNRYQDLLQSLQDEPYSLSLTTSKSTSAESEGEGASEKENNFYMLKFLHKSSDENGKTMMNTRHRFANLLNQENSFGHGALFQSLESIMNIISLWTQPNSQATHQTKDQTTQLKDQTPQTNTHPSKITLIETIISSTPKLMAIANAILFTMYLLHGAVADFFLGPVVLVERGQDGVGGQVQGRGDGGGDVGGRRRNNDTGAAAGVGGGAAAVGDQTRARIRSRRAGRERIFGYLLFKVLLVSAVVTPDTIDFLFLMIWYSTLSFLKSLSHVAGSTISHAMHSGQPPRLGALLLLLLVLTCDMLAVIGCTCLFYDTPSMLLLLTSDCFVLAQDAGVHILRHVGATMEETHRLKVTQLEEDIIVIQDERRNIDANNNDTLQRLENESRSNENEIETREAQHARQVATFDTVVFVLELFGSIVLASHYIHIWVMHGASFGLVDGVLLLHIQSTLSSLGRKIAERRNLNRILREIDETFNDASDLDIRKASTSGDVCCICLVTMNTGNVKKVGCGHLFHKNCLREVVERARSLRLSKCPLCRASLVDGSHPRQPNVNGGNGNDDVGDVQQPIQPANNNPNQNNNNNLPNEQSLFRFSTEGILPEWLPVPAFAFEVVRRETPALAEQNNGNGGGLQRFFRRGGDLDGNVDGPPAQEAEEQQQQQGPEQQQQQSFWRRLFVLAGAIPMSPEEEAVALEQLTDMFPQYDRADLLRELRARGSAEAVVESVFLGVFSGTPRGGVND